MSGGLIQIPIVKKACLANKNGVLMHTFLYLSLFIIHSLICWPSDIPVEKHPNDNNIESNHQRSYIVEKHTSGDAYIWRLTSVLVVTLKLTILLSVTHVNRTHFSAIPLRKSVT